MSKVMGIYVKFTKNTHQIWSCHVTLTSNSENFYFLPYSVSDFRKSYQICGKLAQEQKSYRQKQIGGVESTPPPPVLIGLRNRLKTFQSENGQKFKNSEPQSKFTGSQKKCIVLT